MKLATLIAEHYLMKRQDDLPAHHIEDFLCTGSKFSVFPQCSATSMTAKENEEAKEHKFFLLCWDLVLNAFSDHLYNLYT